jgi:hypothetical protein
LAQSGHWLDSSRGHFGDSDVADVTALAMAGLIQTADVA